MTKKDKKRKFIQKEELSVDNQFDLLGGLGSVYGREIKGVLGRDYVLASFNEDQSVFIEESFENSLDISKIIDDLKNSKIYYYWNEEILDWEKDGEGGYLAKEPDEEEKDKIDKARVRVIKLLRTRPDVLSVLNRNKHQNFLAKVWGNVKEVDEKGNEVETVEQENLIARVKQKLNEDR